MGGGDRLEDQTEIPLMLELLFGDGTTNSIAARQVRHAASPRLLEWCRAFDEWLAERQAKYKAGITRNSVAPWPRLLQQCHTSPG